MASQTRFVFFPFSGPNGVPHLVGSNVVTIPGSGSSIEVGVVRPELQSHPIFEHVTSCK